MLSLCFSLIKVWQCEDCWITSEVLRCWPFLGYYKHLLGVFLAIFGFFYLAFFDSQTIAKTLARLTAVFLAVYCHM